LNKLRSISKGLTANNAPEINLDTWIISDTHFFHENIGKYCNRPENWQDLILKNWNDLIAPDETVLHLGDFALGKKSNFVLLTEFLNGKLFLIRGNHDRLGATYCSSHGVTLVKDPFLVSLGEHNRLVFSHRPIVPLPDGFTNLHGHSYNNPPPPEGSNLGPYHINMSVEVRDYRPWKLRDIVKQSI
jgi:calcineurin-like phosphoesterase family protein